MIGVTASVQIELEQQVGYGVQCGLQLALYRQGFRLPALLLGDVAEHGDEVIHLAIVPAHAFDIYVRKDNRAILADA